MTFRTATEAWDMLRICAAFAVAALLLLSTVAQASDHPSLERRYSLGLQESVAAFPPDDWLHAGHEFTQFGAGGFTNQQIAFETHDFATGPARVAGNVSNYVLVQQPLDANPPYRLPPLADHATDYVEDWLVDQEDHNGEARILPNAVRFQYGSESPGNAVLGEIVPLPIPDEEGLLDGGMLSDGWTDAGCQEPCDSPLSVRFGWWDVSSKGSPTKVGEYQSLDSSYFWNADEIWSDGVRTLNFVGTGLDNDTSQAELWFFGPKIAARAEYQRYLRRRDRDPLSFFVDFDQQPALPLPAPPANFRDMKEDLSVGEDFAIRVQQLDVGVSGKLTKNIDWKLNIWGMRKHGERQATAMAHCFTAPNATDVNGNPVAGVACHVLSQSQRIDWITMEVEPVLKAKYGPVSMEYSRTMRTFSQNDQFLTRPYDNFGFAGDLPYAVVPENFTEIDRFNIGVVLPNRRDGYARLFHGNTENQLRLTNRRFRGFDVRMTDRSINGVKLTAYAKNYVQTGQRPSMLLPEETTATISTPINYQRTNAGLNGRWRPFDGEYSLLSGLALSGGYDYSILERENALFVEQALTVNQGTTVTNALNARAAMRWTPWLDSYVRYRPMFIKDPLYGVPTRNTTTNTNLPTQRHLIDIGGTWTPIERFLLNASVGINNAWNSSDVANFDEDNYDLVFTAWYAPTPKWSFSGGLAFFANWIDQDITLGSKSNPVTLPWNYGGRNDMVNFGTTFAWSDCITLSGGYEFVRGSNVAVAPVPYADVPPLSNVIVEVNRFTTGIDWQLSSRFTSYFRYQFFDYEDKTQNFVNGTVDMILIGVNGVY